MHIMLSRRRLLSSAFHMFFEYLNVDVNLSLKIRKQTRINVKGDCTSRGFKLNPFYNKRF
jgi:hypothetical protein